MAKAPEMITDVDWEKATLGREPAERDHRVDEGNETECRCQSQLQQMNLHEQNWEWEVCASSEMNKVEADGLGARQTHQVGVGMPQAFKWMR
ncbi:hypothetical protein SCLCIDRAFT_34821 [Scleroderma citrinum Foug A]|uniref:Uncharacterized protein n=1 Tax=Scleroderma citrinum Foug A TaxID=1036808 RepID=A0A0C2ZA45_9AGAM|nr:hypothetical protein SCLCIDRAFT_34821 [Scleroderma citrinum Foug A]